MAEFGWIDFSPKDRQRVGTILELMKPSGQVDELGIGTIRDGLADRLFPGISTIQTRAKYFFIIPYILHDFLRMSASDRSKKTPSKYLDDREHEIMWYLSEHYKEKGEENTSRVIGITKKRGERIVRRPSEIYWNGLNTFKCIDSQGLSANAFLNNANKSSLETLAHSIEEEDGKDDKDAGFENFFNVKIPVNENWQENLTLDLSYEEASFLKEAMLDLDNTLLSYVVSDAGIYEEFKTASSFEDFIKFAVEKDIPSELKHDLILAHDFAELMIGAHLAYNQELQKHFYEHDPFEEIWNDWYSNFKSRMINPESFDPDHLFVYTSPDKAGQFIHDWWRLVNADELDQARKSQIIKRQERWAKRSKARISNNRRNDVKESIQLGLGRLEYRFSNAKIIINDVFEGLIND
jgi:hypothetical protein